MQQVRQAIVLHVRVSSGVEKAARLLEPHSDVAKVEIRPPDLLVVTLKKGVHDYSFLPSLLIENGLKLLLFREEELNLETAFMELTRGLVQ
jgi:ABC-2 type transport system ATP-binding protein